MTSVGRAQEIHDDVVARLRDQKLPRDEREALLHERTALQVGFPGLATSRTGDGRRADPKTMRRIVGRR